MKLNKKVRFMIAAIVSVVVCILLCAVRLTGEPIHMLLGMVVCLIIIIHVCRKGQRLKYIPRSWRMTDLILAGAAFVVLVTGMMIHPMQNMVFLGLHKLGAVVMIVGCIVHCIQHKKRKGIQKNVS